MLDEEATSHDALFYNFTSAVLALMYILCNALYSSILNTT